MTPRLLDVHATATYLGVCPGTVRALVAKGVLLPVRPPSMRRPGEPSRRLLFDVRDLDAVVDSWKAATSSEPNAQLSQAALTGWENRRKRGAA